MANNLGVTPREQDYSAWYNDVVEKAGLAEHSDVRGCMVIKPHGYAIWEHMQRGLDDMFKATGHQNAYFPLFVPKSFLSKEADHVEGFAKECAVVTHYRLMNDPNGGGVIVDPTAKLEEELIIRPTSETIIWNTYRNWIQSYRDLPILVNQWANVVRWERRTRLFLRTAEFLWQEGHTAHETYEEAEEEAMKMLGVYKTFAEEFLAVPVITGVKSEGEKFAGADHTYCIEALVQDGRAIQAGTSHHLGQNFAKAFDVKFQSRDGKLEHVYATSWGVSTRLIGTLIMAHSDDKGLVLPPRIAPIQVVIVPIGKDADRPRVMEEANRIAGELRGLRWKDEKVRVHVDTRENLSPGFKFNDWELKGACIRIELGPRDIDNQACPVSRRDAEGKEIVGFDQLGNKVLDYLESAQNNLLQIATERREKMTQRVDTWDEFAKVFEGEGGSGFVIAHWDGTQETEDKIAEITKATIRCIPLQPLHPDDAKPGTCVFSGKPSKQRVIFAKAY